MQWLVLLLAISTPTQVKLVEPQKEAVLRKCVPSTTDAEINRISKDPATMYYTEVEMPSAYQLEGMHTGRTSFHDSRFNIGPTGIPRTNGNVEFPWLKPGGTDNCPGVTSFKFVHLPQGKPVVYYQKPMPWHESVDSIGGKPMGLSWCFPKGTVFGEVLLMRAPDGRDYTFEMRVRQKEDGFWDVNIFRPYPTSKDLLKAIGSGDAVSAHLSSTRPAVQRLSDTSHPTRQAFTVDSGVDVLPPLSTVEPAKLLRVKFKSALGRTWREGCFAPTTRAEFHIVPKDYQGTFLGTDAQSCTKCHESAQRDTGYFELARDWYGYVRGSDQILSWHPVEPSSLIRDASDGPTVLRQAFLDAGILVPFDPAQHGDYKPAQ